MSDETDQAPELRFRFYLVTAPDTVVTGCGHSSVTPDGASEVAEDVYAAAAPKLGACKFIGGALQDYTPPAAPTPTPIAVPKPGLVRALMARGDWKAVKAFIAADETTQDLWDATQNVVLADPLTQGLIAKMKYDDATVRAIMLASIGASV